MTQAHPHPQVSKARPEFGLIIVGDEILSGKRADKHMPKVIELLSARGLSLDWADYVGDSPERITRTLARAFECNSIVFSCGGIGATPDDHTRQCAGKALGLDIVLHPEAEALIRERIQDTAKEQGVPYEPDRHDNIHRLNMGVFPVGASIIPNPYNKIPGFTCHGASGWRCALCAGLSGDGVADDGMGARHAIHTPVSARCLDRAVHRDLWFDGGHHHAADGSLGARL